MKYREPLFRPPAEAESLIFQIAYGCPHNSCRFCGMYKGVRYEERPIPDVLADFAWAARRYPESRRIFLADGDAMHLSFATLKFYLERLNALFPSLARVSVYANGSSLLAKSPDELSELRRLKLTLAYLGLETGDEELLRLVRKGETAEGMLRAVRLAQDCGIKCSVMVLLGLGGTEYSERHAVATAGVLNAMQPRLLSALRYVEIPGLRCFDSYRALSEYAAVGELREIISRLELERTVFRANHTSNPIPLGGRLPQDKNILLAELDATLKSSILDAEGPGELPLFL